MQIKLIKPVNLGIVLLILMLTAGIGSTDPINVDFVNLYRGSECVDMITISGDYAYIAQGMDLVVLDISDVSNPSEIGKVTTPSSIQGFTVASGYAYIADYDAGLLIVDVRNPSSPTLAGSYDSETACGVTVAEGYAYVADGYNGLLIVDVRNPSSPIRVGKYSPNLVSLGCYRAVVTIADDYAYVADGYNGLLIVDVRNPSSPTLAASYDTAGYVAGVTVAEGYAYVADGYNGLLIVDVRNPSSPTLAGSYDSETACGVTVAEGYAYVADGYNGLLIVDVRNPSSPTLAGSYDTDSYAYSVAVAGNYVYVADSENGLVILQTDIQNQITVGQDASTPEIEQLFIDAYNRNGGSSVLGNPTTKVYETLALGFEVQHFPGVSNIPGGVIMYNPAKNTAYYIHGAIWEKYSSYVDKSKLGPLADDEQEAAIYPQGTTGRYTKFETGTIHWISDEFGENIGHLQRGKSFVTYGDLDKVYTDIGGTYSDLGFPIMDQEEREGHEYCEFEGGKIEWDDSTSAYVVKLNNVDSTIKVGEGATPTEITQKFLEAYERNGGLSVLGEPTTKVYEAFGFQVQDFPGASGIPGGVIMYNSIRNNASYIHGAIWNMYYNYPNKAQLGPVAEDEKEAATSPKGTTGRYTKFQTGTIHWISNENDANAGHPQRDKAFTTYGELDEMYTDLGGTYSYFGFPLMNQTEVDGHGYCEFEGGTIEWSGDRYDRFVYIAGSIKYFDKPLKYAKVELDNDRNTKNGNLGSGNAKSDGSFVIKMKDEDNINSIYVRIYADTTGSEVDKVVIHRVYNEEAFYYTTEVSKSVFSNGIALTIDDSPTENNKIFAMYLNYIAAYEYFSKYLYLGKVTVKLDNTAETGSYANSAITINFNKYSETHDDIELYHEYGHFVMDSPHGVLLYTPKSIYSVTDDSFNVLIDEAPNSEYSWIEGWAFFMSAVNSGDKTIHVPGGYIDLDNAKSALEKLPIPIYAPKSSKNAIRNGAFLWDVYDGKGGWDITEQADQFDGGNDIQNIVDIITDEKVYSTQYGNHETYEHQTPLSVKEFYDSWVSSDKTQRNELTELVKYHFKEYKHIKAYSPVNLHLFDSNGNHIGVNNTTGAIDKEIVGSYYSGPESHPEEIFVISSDDNNEFSCVIEGEEEGTFTLEFENAGNGKVVNTTYENVIVKTNSVGYLETSIDDEQHLLSMDYDGDGVIDESIAPSSIEIDETNDNSLASITNLQAISGITWLNFTWVNPEDSGFNHTEIYLDGIFQTNTSSEYFNFSGLQPSTSYTISTRTVDIYGNVNQTWVNLTGTTLPLVDFTANSTSGAEPLNVKFTDHSTDAALWEWNFGDGTPISHEQNPLHIYAENGEYTVTLTVTDDDGGVGTDTLTVTVNNVNPVLGTITLPIDPCKVNTPVSVSSSFNDAGILDTHEAVWDFGDGTTSAGTVTEENGAGIVTGEHTYTKAGIYRVALTVTDDDGGIVSKTSESYVVVYDSTGGFVTGGGWINSPAGAYLADTTLAGKATFTLESKYKKGATVPTDNTNFQLKVANLDFKSTSCDWLVIAGAQAKYKGTGTINGEGNYGFMLSAVDGAIKGDGIDRFRIKIWDKATDAIVYDNEIGVSEDAEPSTVIGGGSIVIHKVK